MSSTAVDTDADTEQQAVAAAQAAAQDEASTRYDAARDVTSWKCPKCDVTCFSKRGLTNHDSIKHP